MADKLRHVHVDRERELQRFKEMIGAAGGAHVLLISAEEGMGKTTLLGEFWEQASGHRRALVTLKPTYTPRDVLDRLTTQLDPGGFPTFARRDEELYQLSRLNLAAATAKIPTTQEAAPGLSADVQSRLRRALRETGSFESEQRLRTLFVDQRIQPWERFLKEASSPGERIDNVLSQLFDRFDGETEENALVLLLHVLASQLHERDMLHVQLLRLARELEQEVRPILDAQASGTASLHVGGHLEARRRRVSAQLDPAELQKERRIRLTKAFFRDLLDLRAPDGAVAVLLFDDFDQANHDVRQWVADDFLNRIFPHRWLVVVIVGNPGPKLEITGRDWCLSSTLSPLEMAHVREYVQRLELEVRSGFIELLYVTSKGKPLRMREVIEDWLEWSGGGMRDAR